MQRTFTDQQIFDGLHSRDAPTINAIVSFLYRQCQRSVTRMVLQNNGTETEADDLFQDVILVFLQNTRSGKYQLRSDAQVSTYIYTLAHRMWLRALRTQSGWNRRNDRYAQQQHDEQPDTPSPEQKFIDEEDVRSAQSIFGQLGEACQWLLKAFYAEKKSMKQIADELGLESEDTVKTRKYRCVLSLRKLMAS